MDHSAPKSLLTSKDMITYFFFIRMTVERHASLASEIYLGLKHVESRV